MKYVVVVYHPATGPAGLKVYAATGGGFLDMDSAQQWAQGHLGADSDWSWVIAELDVAADQVAPQREGTPTPEAVQIPVEVAPAYQPPPLPTVEEEEIEAQAEEEPEPEPEDEPSHPTPRRRRK